MMDKEKILKDLKLTISISNFEKEEKSTDFSQIPQGPRNFFKKYKKEVMKSSKCHMKTLLQFPQKTVTL